MKDGLYRVVECLATEAYTRKDGTEGNMRVLVLQEIGGWTGNDTADSYSNAIAAKVFGNLALCEFGKNEVVYATFRTSSSRVGAKWYTDVTISDICRIR